VEEDARVPPRRPDSPITVEVWELLAVMLRSGNAGPNTSVKHIEVTGWHWPQLPRRLQHRSLIRADSGGSAHQFLPLLPARLHYSAGMTITDDIQQAIPAMPERIWEPAYDAGGQARPRG
jgi:hypothetical protein